MSLIKSTLQQVRKERAAGMLKTARFSAYTELQLDAVEDVLTQLLAAEALGDVEQAASHSMAPLVSPEALNASEPYKQRLKRSAERGLAGKVISEQELFALLEEDDERQARATLKALAGTQDVKKVPRR